MGPSEVEGQFWSCPWVVQTLAAEGRRRAAVAVAVTEAGHGADLPGHPLHPGR